MKSYTEKKTKRSIDQFLKEGAMAKMAEGKLESAEAVRAFHRPPYYMRKKEAKDNDE